MDYNDEQYNSDILLAEKIFSQLKEYNSEKCNEDEQPDHTANNGVSKDITSEEKGSSSELNSGVEDHCEISNEQSLDQCEDSNQPPPDQCEMLTQPCSEEPMDLTSQYEEQVTISEISELKEQKDSVVVIDEEHTQQYLDLLIASLPPECYSDDVIVVKDSLKSENCVIKCNNCEQIFNEEAFNEHICDYDENKNFIKDEEPIKCPTIELEEPPCLRQLKENNTRIRKFLKDELKIDIGGPTKRSDGPHECNMCERKFVHASGLVRHMEKHAMDLIPITTNTTQAGSGLKVVIKCLICGRILFGHVEAMEHLNENHAHLLIDDETDSEKDFPNERIDEAIEFILKETTDEQTDTTTNPYLKVVILTCTLQCEFCDLLFSEVSDLLLHASTHDPMRGFECSSCGINVPTAKEIFLHWQAECPYVRDELKKINNLQKYLVCNVCENKYTSHEQLYDHRYTEFHLFPRLNRSMGIMQVCCEYCGSFHESARAIMRHHEEKHMKKAKKEATAKYRQYLCDVCGKSYTQSSHLWQHLRFHRGVKPFACKEPGCSRRFTIRPDLNDHIRKCHTGERPYHCLVCGKRFLTGSVFYQHRLIHRGERRYGCDECGKRFYRADALKNHQRIHTGEKPYACMYCTKNFRQRGDRDKHIRARHANLDATARSFNMKNKDSSHNGVVFVGNVAFPTSMFKPMMRDIDECPNMY